MKHRRNILPAWLQKAGYRTALIGKWLNGYGAKDAHGEIPHGFDIWRGLLDVSAYDYFNFVMNINGKLKIWGDKDFARKLVKFANIEVSPGEKTIGDVLTWAHSLFAPGDFGSEKTKDYSPDVTGADGPADRSPPAALAQAVLRLVVPGFSSPRGRRDHHPRPARAPTRARRRATAIAPSTSSSPARRRSTTATRPIPTTSSPSCRR